MGKKTVLIVPAALLLLVAGVLFMQTTTTAQTSTNAEVERGRYLVTIGGCADCHTPKLMTAQGPVPDESRSLSGHPSSEVVPALAPGQIDPAKWLAMCNANMTAWAGPWGVSFAANLTSDKKLGIGGWNAEQFIKAMRTGKHRGYGRDILPPMPWFNLAQATDDDLRSMFAYLQTVPAIANQVPEPVPPAGQ